jgi:hypothetical protein
MPVPKALAGHQAFSLKALILTAKSSGLVQKLEGTLQGNEAAEIAAVLEKMVKEDESRAQKPPRPFNEMTKEQKIGELIQAPVSILEVLRAAPRMIDQKSYPRLNAPCGQAARHRRGGVTW